MTRIRGMERNIMETRRKIVEIDEERCDGCGQCAGACAEGAIRIVDGKARLVKDSFCDGLGACIGECPRGALKIIERDAEEFDPVAVERHMKEEEGPGPVQAPVMACGCPSSQVRMFDLPREKPAVAVGRPQERASALSHWPVQIRLVPANAPFLKGAHLLVASDCVPVAYPDFHRDFVDGRVVLLGCPKFDDRAEYVRKFAEIFRTADVRSVTVVDMEVPCCSAMPAIVRKGMELSGGTVPMEEVVIGVRGEIVSRRGKSAA